MTRILGKVIQVLVVIALALYLGDWAVLRLRAADRQSSSVQVEQFLKTPLKGQKDEFDYMGPVTQPCVVAPVSPRIAGSLLVGEAAQRAVDLLLTERIAQWVELPAGRVRMDMHESGRHDLLTSFAHGDRVAGAG